MVGSWNHSDQPAWGVWFSSDLSTRLPAHRHSGLEVNLLISGRLVYHAGESEIEVLPRQAILLPAHQSHELLVVAPGSTLWVIEAPAHQGFDESLARVLFPPEALWQTLTYASRQLWLRPPPGKRALFEEQLLTAFAQLVELPQGLPYATSAFSEAHPAVQRARRYCEENAPLDGDINALARRAGLSASRLAHLFSEQVGLSPLQYRNFARVQNFIRTFHRGESSLLDAALAAGFGSYPQFHRVFRQVCGVSPQEHMNFLAGSTVVDARLTLGQPALR
jgi:AraC-like DNA-binding protein